MEWMSQLEDSRSIPAVVISLSTLEVSFIVRMLENMYESVSNQLLYIRTSRNEGKSRI
jgi:hypothetical protein